MIDIVRSYILKNNLIEKKDKVLIALSGGIDSMVLFDLLLKLKDELDFSLYAAHFDHNIRKESKSDALFVKKYCQDAGIDLQISSGDTLLYAKKEKLSLETAARNLRHSFLKQAAVEVGADKIAFAHHKNDRAETYLMRVLRGSGGDGLGCMPQKDGNIVRPLLCVEKKEIIHYANVNALKWREDKTNTNTEYTRNNIRLKTLPHLAKNYNESIINTLSNNAELMAVDRDYFKAEVEKAVKKAKQTEDGYYLDDDSFIYLHKAILTRCILKVLSMIGAENDIYEKNIAQVLELFYLQKTGAKINLPNDIIARRDAFGVELIRGEKAVPVFLETILTQNGVTYIPNCGTFICKDTEINLKNIKNHSKNVAFFDTISVKNELTVRTRKEGDSFHPLGAPGKKSLKKYFIDKKISRFVRDSIPLVTSGEEVLWIVGHEVSDKIKVTEDSLLVKKLVFHKENKN